MQPVQSQGVAMREKHSHGATYKVALFQPQELSQALVLCDVIVICHNALAICRRLGFRVRKWCRTSRNKATSTGHFATACAILSTPLVRDGIV